MKLQTLLTVRLLPLLAIVIALWAACFYVALMEEVNDEVDDSLEDYAEWLILRSLAGEEMPSASSGSNNQFYLHPVSPAYAASHPQITYRDEMVYLESKGETEPARVLTTLFRAGEDRWMELVVYTPTIEKLDLQRAILGWIVFLYLLLLLLVVGVTLWVFRRNMKPLYTLLSWLDDYRLGRANRPLDTRTRVHEFRRLNEAALASSRRSEMLYEQQKLFTGNASHEMQTPLAICLNRLEMLMEDDGLTPAQQEELAKTHRTLEHLTRMNRSLLLLCKIENGQFADDREPVCLDALLHRYLDDYRDAYAHLHHRVDVHLEAPFRVATGETLAAVLLTNLLKNAFTHTPAGGRILIGSTPECFTVANSGTAPLDASRIFERFYRAHKQEGSTGLGLALVQSVCKACGLHIRYRFAEGMHRFELIHG